jgi:chaperonin GroEL
VADSAQIAQVGIISANGDVEVGQKIAEAMERSARKA